MVTERSPRLAHGCGTGKPVSKGDLFDDGQKKLLIQGIEAPCPTATYVIMRRE